MTREILLYTVHAPRIGATEWVMFAARPPDLPGQTITSARTAPVNSDLWGAVDILHGEIKSAIQDGRGDTEECKRLIELQQQLLEILRQR